MVFVNPYISATQYISCIKYRQIRFCSVCNKKKRPPLIDYRWKPGKATAMLLPTLDTQSSIPVGRTGISHGLRIIFEYLDDLGAPAALCGRLVPELHCSVFHLFPLFTGNGCKLEFPALGSIVGFSPPVPVLPIVVRTIHLQTEQCFQVFRQSVP